MRREGKIHLSQNRYDDELQRYDHISICHCYRCGVVRIMRTSTETIGPNEGTSESLL